MTPFERYRPIIDDWAAFSEAIAAPLPRCFWTNPLRPMSREVVGDLSMRGASTEPIAWRSGAHKLYGVERPGNLWEFRSGLIHIQEEVSMIPVAVLDPQPGERVADLCAAPGNKTAEIALRMQNRGTVIANDANYGRLRGLAMNCQRLGLANVAMTHANAVVLPDALGLFDRVLADVPCSCEGNVRKNTAMLTESGKPKRFNTGVQRAILKRALELTRAGGRVVYSTCTFAPEENEQVLDDLLKEQGCPDFRVLPIPDLGLVHSPGLRTWGERTFDASLQHCMRLYPHHNDTGGFFVALLERVSDSTPVPKPDFEAPGAAVNADWLERLWEQFGIAPKVLDGFVALQESRQIALCPTDSLFPNRSALMTRGLPFYRTSMATPRPTSAIAMFAGHHATRNVVDLTEEQTDAYLRREVVRLVDGQATSCSDRGHIMVRYKKTGLGMGMLRRGPGDSNISIESMLPKGLALASGVSAFQV